jgi:hypothetical protein
VAEELLVVLVELNKQEILIRVQRAWPELGEMVVLVLAEVPEVMNVPQIMLD